MKRLIQSRLALLALLVLIPLAAHAAQRLRGNVIIDHLTYGPATQQTSCGTVATTGNTDCYIVAPQAGSLAAAYISPGATLATSDSNYLTFSITNLGQDGTGSFAMLASSTANTTKTTGGSALTASAIRSLTLNDSANLTVAAGDRLRIRNAATGTLNNTVTTTVYVVNFAVPVYPTGTATATPTATPTNTPTRTPTP